MNELGYIKEAYLEALRHSTDPSTQNGAVLVSPNREIVSYGANHFPSGVVESPERWERPAKYAYVEHAERNAIFNAARKGIATQGLVMVCPWYACTDCARAIIQAGIVCVIGHETPLHDNASKSWKDSVAIGDKMLDEAGVERVYVPGRIGLFFKFNGEWTEV